MATKKKEEAKTSETPGKAEKADGKRKDRDASGKFAKGHEKRGGRKPGTKNRAGNVRDRLKEQVEPFVEQIGEMLARVMKEEGTKEMLYAMEKFMPYFMPKYSALSIGADQDRPIDEEERLLELDAKYTKKELSINFKTMIVVDNDAVRDTDDPDDDPNFDISQFGLED